MDLDNEALVTWFQSLHNPSGLSVPRAGANQSMVIAGNLPLMGQLRLLLLLKKQPDGASFAFTNHPHYEDAQLRYRTILADSVYSFKSVADIWHIYRHVLDADFVVVNEFECRPDERGCSRTELFRLMEGGEAKGRSQPLCNSLFPLSTSSSSTVSTFATPAELAPFFNVVYVDGFRGRRVVLLVRS